MTNWFIIYIHDNYYNTCIIVDITVKKKLQVQNTILTYCKLLLLSPGLIYLCKGF